MPLRPQGPPASRTRGLDPVALAFRRAVMGMEGLVKSALEVEVAAWDLDPQPVEPLESPGEVAVALDLLEHVVETLPKGRRRRDLEADLRALRTILRILEGREVPYRERAREMIQCPTVAPGEGEMGRLRDGLEEVARGAGLRGELGEALRRWEAADAIPPQEVGEVARGAMAEARSATAATVGLPDGESVELRVVTGRPWSGFSDYKGGMVSTVQVNADLPWTASEMKLLMTHEAYPGHHTDVVWKVHHYRSGTLAPDRAVSFSGSPEGPVSEGLAEYGARVVGRTGPVDSLSSALSLHRFAVSLKACIGVWEKGWDGPEAIEFIAEEAFTTRARAEHSWRFITHPLYGPHAFSYYHGTTAVATAHRRALEAGREREFLGLLYRTPYTLEGFAEAVDGLLS